MKKVTYINTLVYKYDSTNRSHYYIPQINKNRNRGELCESIAKNYRGIFTEVNPNISFDTGSDIEEEHASVKSSRFGLANNYGDSTTISEAIKYYFKKVASSTFIYMHFDEETQEVIEYQMNKREFGGFINACTTCRISKSTGTIEVRGLTNEKKVLEWLDARC